MTQNNRILAAAVLAAMLPITAHSAPKEKRPRFEDFKTTDIFQGKQADLILTKEDREFRTRLREGAKEKPNFAGHYVLTTWGAGCGIICGAAIDAKTGSVHWLPGSVCCMNPPINGVPDTEESALYKVDSKLIILNGLIGETGINGSHYYKFENNKFIHIKTIKTPPPKCDEE